MNPSSRPDCVWCGAPLRDGRFLRGRIRCRACGAATTDPWPSEAALEEAYAGCYRPAGGRFAGVGDAVLRRTRGRLASRLDRIAPAGPVLDVGAGDGTLLDALRAHGREAIGSERSNGQPVAGPKGGLDEAGGRWAAVVFWHSLEHLPEPGVAIEQAAGLLRDGGLLIVAVPNSSSLQARAFGDRWLALDPPRHLVHLTRDALLDRLCSLGLRLERVSSLRGGQVAFGWLHGLVGVLPGRPDLYQAIRRPEARSKPLSSGQRMIALGAAAIMLPVAVAMTALEVAMRQGGTIYVEARRP